MIRPRAWRGVTGLGGWPGLVLFSAALLLSAPASAGPGYISDEINVTVRQRPTNDAEPVATLRSGTAVAVLESLGPDSFARIRTADGREGWIATRYLSSQPAARDQLTQQRQQLDQAHAQAQSLQHDLQQAQQQLAQARPALEMASENDKLRSAIAERERQVSALEQKFDAERARRDTLVTGAALVAGGMLLGLVLPWMGGRKRRRSDF
ncbi:MAG: TIGR04211 family SH3 domain-containing protein [Nevskia sp.]|nr:TIGR04211 family SH3 domain-containing protein [Nevskia sp.]